MMHENYLLVHGGVFVIMGMIINPIAVYMPVEAFGFFLLVVGLITVGISIGIYLQKEEE